MRKSKSILIYFVLTAFAINNCMIHSSAEDKPPEILSLRNAYEKHFQNSDGTITSFVYATPIHYYENGMWNEYNNKWIKDKAGFYSVSNGPMQVTLAPFTLNHDENVAEKNKTINISYKDYSLGLDVVNSNHKIQTKRSSALSIDSTKEKMTISSDNVELSAIMSEYMSKVNSSLTYNSVFDDTDLNICIQPSSVYASFTIQSQEDTETDYSFLIYSPELVATLDEENNTYFSNSDEEVIFAIPYPIIYDSNNECCTAVNVELTQTTDGYLYSIHPDTDWMTDDERNYPVTVSTQTMISEHSNIDICYNSEANPYSIKRDIYMKVGSETGNGYQSYVTIQDSFTSFSNNTTITDAKFYFYFHPNENSRKMCVYSNNIEPMNVSWNSSSTLTSYNTKVSEFTVPVLSSYTQVACDITALCCSWLNYAKTLSSNIGVPNYGFKVCAAANNQPTFTAYSNNSRYYKPYYTITYQVDSDYVLTESRYKYDNIIDNSHGNIYNFQNRMNCYAYALQMYYKGSNNNFHQLYPGEIGLGQTNPSYSYNNILTFNQLSNAYSELYGNELLQFTDEQMKKDAQAMGYSITNLSYGSSVCISNHNTWLQYIRNTYDQDTGRIIVLTATTSSPDPHDVHFFMRHGNGTCTDSEHDDSCSVWSHKPGNYAIHTGLCDETIYAGSREYNNYKYSSGPWFYNISKSTCAYDAWFYDGHTSNSNGTEFVIR